MSQYYTVARVGEIADGEGRACEIAGRVIAVFNDGGAFHAIDDRCPHAGASLSCGSVVEGTVICAWHGWRFRLRDGSWADYSKIKIRVYPVRVVGDEIQVEMPGPESPDADQ